MNHTAATIQGQTFHYEGPLTIEEIEEHRDTIIMMYIGRPTYLFLTEQGHRELAAAATQFYNSLCEPGEQKELSTLSMLCGLHVVVLPTLPENTLIIGKFLLNTTEEKLQVLYDLQDTTRPEGLD